MFGQLSRIGAIIACLAVLGPANLSIAAAPPPAALPRPAAPAVQMPVLPQPIVTLALVRTVLLAVDQANKTGNYTVVRDMGSPNFYNANDAARLAQIFAPLKAQGMDMLAVAVVDPIYTGPPRITDKRMLYVAGQFPITPRAVKFELLFEVVRGQWRVYGVSIAPG